jgi:hypothetical protein
VKEVCAVPKIDAAVANFHLQAMGRWRENRVRRDGQFGLRKPPASPRLQRPEFRQYQTPASPATCPTGMRHSSPSHVIPRQPSARKNISAEGRSFNADAIAPICGLGKDCENIGEDPFAKLSCVRKTRARLVHQ